MVWQSSQAADIGPTDEIEYLQKQPLQQHTFIVRFNDGIVPSLAQFGISEKSEITKPLFLINGLAAIITSQKAFEISEDPNIRQVWYLHPNLSNLYVKIIEALDSHVRTLPLPNLVNLSIGPQVRFWRQSPEINTPMNAATRAAAEAGLIPIVAIGNISGTGDQVNGYISPWCYPEWVICVGAYDQVKGEIPGFSARGDPNDSESWPDVVAHGVDVIGPYPSNLVKSQVRSSRDESNVMFTRVVPRDKWNLYTLASGTSQAAANVTGAATQVLHFLRYLIQDGTNTQAEQPLFSLTASRDWDTQYDRVVERLTGTARKQPDGSIVYEYPLDLPWKMVKQLILDTAIPLTNEHVHAVGAGLVDRNYINQQFGQYGIAKPEIVPSRVH